MTVAYGTRPTFLHDLVFGRPETIRLSENSGILPATRRQVIASRWWTFKVVHLWPIKRRIRYMREPRPFGTRLVLRYSAWIHQNQPTRRGPHPMSTMRCHSCDQCMADAEREIRLAALVAAGGLVHVFRRVRP